MENSYLKNEKINQAFGQGCFNEESSLQTRSNSSVAGFVSDEAEIEQNVTIYPNVFILGKCKIGKNCVIGSGTTIEDSVIGKDTEIRSSVIENSIVGDHVKIGPFAHIRPNSVIGSGCKIGNFVEIKASKLGINTKVSHLAYVGNAEIGDACNIGCGAIFVNYNGKQKQTTIVGNNCFIGSNCNIIAPLSISDNSYICAGTTLTQNTSSGDFVIGRTRETIKKNRAQKYLKEQA